MDRNPKRIDEHIDSPFPGKTWYVEKTDSTMETARKMAGRGMAEHGCVIRAGIQTAGRGRGKGRKWESAADENLLFTILIEKERVEIPISAFPLAAGLAVAVTVEGYDLSPSVKWPNDILCAGKKICGILCETVGDYLSAGIGLNCNQMIFSENLRYPPSSLGLLTGRKFNPADVLKDFLPNLYSVLTAGTWRGEVENRLYARGKTVELSEGGADTGDRSRIVIKGIGEQGELLIMENHGKIRKIFSGEILYGRS